MHIGAAISLQLSRHSRPSAVGTGTGSQRYTWLCFPCSLLPLGIHEHKLHVWCLLGFLVGSSVLCIGMFEFTRLTTHVLRSPCTVLSSEVLDVGTCTLCDDMSPQHCEVHPIATARLFVSFQPMHSSENVTGYVWFCKGRASVDPCQRQLDFIDQLALDSEAFGQEHRAGGPIPCAVGEVFSYMQRHAMEGNTRECYYSSRDPKGEDVWFSMPSPGLVDHAWFQKHLEYPVLLALGGLVLLSVLLGCLALEGAELWAAGFV